MMPGRAGGQDGGVERLILVLAVVGAAVVVAQIAARRRPDVPTQPRGSVPAQLDRDDFSDPDVPWLVAVFTSSTCGSCQGVVERAEVLANAEVAVVEVEAGAEREIHQRYGIDAVPTVVVAGPDGVVVRGFVGPPTATDLWAAVAEARDPGSTPESDLGRAAPDA